MERKINIDLVKVLACMMVIVLHVSSEFFYLFDDRWYIVNMFDSATRACVPLFFMCSGALLLTKNDQIGLFYRKRFLKILPPLFFWSFLYLFLYGYMYGEMSLYDVTRQIFYGVAAQNFHLWFLYALAGLYLFCPFLKKIYLYSSKNEIHIFICIWFMVSSIVPCVENVFNIEHFESSFNTVYFTGFIGYFVIGKYVYAINNSTKNLLYAIIVYFITLSCIYYSTHYISLIFKKPSQIFYDYLSPFVVINSLSLFYILLNINIKNIYISNIITKISVCSYGIYCVHLFFLRHLPINLGINMTQYIIIKSILIFACSFTVIAMYKYIVKNKLNNNYVLESIV